jgi:hypothetical protein
MCGGYKATIKDISDKDLKRFYTPEQIEHLKKSGFIESRFWDKRPVLPVEFDGQIRLFDWGNRDKKAPFPVTGWAKKESIDAGRWKYLRPEEIKIPISKGYEKKVWFDMPEGTKGLLVEKQGDKRVYMITEEAHEQYLRKTKHPRMPVGKKENFVSEK